MANQFKVGDRVKPKASYVKYCSDGTYKNYEYSVITRVSSNGINYNYESFNADGKRISSCDCYKDEHLELYGEPMPKRTFMLRKDTPSMLKGALLQDNGNSTSPYTLINAETHSKDPSFPISFAKRELIEEAPTWFIEVFAVTPPYMTQIELDQYETFKKTLKTKQTKKVKKA